MLRTALAFFYSQRLARITSPAVSGLLLALIVGAIAVTASAQEISGTLYIRDDTTGGDCTSAGTWEYSTKTCTLTTDLNFSGTDGIVIASDGVTLDGDGHSLTGGGTIWYTGVGLNRKSNVVIKNLTIKQFSNGIYLYSSTGNTISGNTVSSNDRGIWVSSFGPGAGPSTGNTLSGNTVSSNDLMGIWLYHADGNTLTGNIASLNNNGIIIEFSSGNTLAGNTLAENTWRNFVLEAGQDSDYDNNIDTTNLLDGKPIYYVKNATGQTFDASSNAGIFYCISCSDIIIRDLTLSNNTVGLYLRNTRNSRVENVNSSNNGVGIRLDLSSGNTLSGNTANENTASVIDPVGIYLDNSDGNTLSGNTASLNNTGIRLLSSTRNTLSSNTISSNSYGITLSGSSGNTLSSNTVSSNSHGISLGGSHGNTLAANTVSSNHEEGISLWGSSSNTINGNTAASN